MSAPIVLTMKWGTLFPADYVNVLFNACRRASRQEFRFVCLTDDPSGFHEGIEYYPLPEINLPPEAWFQPGVWPKLALYRSDIFGLTGRCLFIDLDMMVLRDLDSFFDHSAPFVATDMGKAWQPEPGSAPAEAGSCIFAFNLGQETQILTAFENDTSAARRDFDNEQVFMAAHASSMAYWPHGWVISFKRWLRQPMGKDLFVAPRRPPPTAKVIAFHGTPRPGALLGAGLNFWDRFPHMGHGRVEWVADYWRENGGSLK